jgi:uncharacterized membrane protein YgaE (UPF0421/DUF939 family)
MSLMVQSYFRAICTPLMAIIGKYDICHFRTKVERMMKIMFYDRSIQILLFPNSYKNEYNG